MMFLMASRGLPLALLLVACGPKAPPTHPPDQPAAVGTAVEGSFHFVRVIGGQIYIVLNEDDIGSVKPAAIIDAKAPTTLLQMTDPIAIGQDLPAGLLGNLETSSWQVFKESEAWCLSAAGDPLIVGLVIPHFGDLQQLEEARIDLSADEGAGRRAAFLGDSSVSIMVPLEGCEDAPSGPGLLWSMPLGASPARVSAFAELTGEAGDEAEELALGLDEWKEIEARVAQAYEGATEDDGSPMLPGLDVDAYGADGWIVVRAKIGNAECGRGPDEGLLVTLWERRDDGLALVLIREEELEPVLIGDFDGDEELEIVAYTDPYTEAIEIFRLVGGALEPAGITDSAYFDCPC
jgi:hypothetical protein